MFGNLRGNVVERNTVFKRVVPKPVVPPTFDNNDVFFIVRYVDGAPLNPGVPDFGVDCVVIPPDLEVEPLTLIPNTDVPVVLLVFAMLYNYRICL